MNKLKHMSHIVNRAIGTLVEILDEKVSRNAEFDIFKMFQGLTCDVIGECALAMKVNISETFKTFRFDKFSVRILVKNGITYICNVLFRLTAKEILTTFFSNRFDSFWTMQSTQVIK